MMAKMKRKRRLRERNDSVPNGNCPGAPRNLNFTSIGQFLNCRTIMYRYTSVNYRHNAAIDVTRFSMDIWPSRVRPDRLSRSKPCNRKRSPRQFFCEPAQSWILLGGSNILRMPIEFCLRDFHRESIRTVPLQRSAAKDIQTDSGIPSINCSDTDNICFNRTLPSLQSKLNWGVFPCEKRRRSHDDMQDPAAAIGSSISRCLQGPQKQFI
jgi:hypothetical protein